MVKIQNLLTRSKAMFLAYDHGVEHGPSDFNLRSVDPDSALNIAHEGDYNGIVLHHGVAEKYYKGAYKDVPLIAKLNGKTNLSHLNPLSSQICSVDRALKLGASALGYTVYDGSPSESEMFKEFGDVVERAHDYGVPVVAWMTPRGPEVHHETSTENLAYAARLGLELGADFVVVKYNNDPSGFPWIVKSAGKCKVIVSGGERIDDHKVLHTVHRAIHSGAKGVIMGRNVWLHPKPFSMTKAIQDLVFKKSTAEEAMKRLH